MSPKHRSREGSGFARFALALALLSLVGSIVAIVLIGTGAL